MTATSTLISLACLLANNGSMDTTSLEAQMTESDQRQVVQIIDSGLCLPESLEHVLIQSKHKLGDGNIIAHSPSDGCFTDKTNGN